jgi:glutathione synthase/RimK-type ligase-like ATP-grasp enzyme
MHTPLRQDISDWLEVKRRIEEKAPDIEVRIATNGERNSVIRRWQVSRPSLVFCAGPLWAYQPTGGTIYAAHLIDKFEQVERLRQRGIAVPRTGMLSRKLVLEPAYWGPYLVAKPLRGGKGQAIRLIRTEEVTRRFDELTLNGRRSMVIQTYIDHSENGCPTAYRVLTLFGRVLYSGRNSWAKPRQSLEEIASDPEGIIASNDPSFGRERRVSNDPDVISLSEAAHAAFPESPLLGVDVVRDTATGKLYVLEVNPEGWTWHFSSSTGKTYPADYIRDIYAQFGALDRVAQLLIEKTRAEAA